MSTSKLKLTLFLLRVSVFLVMFMWTMDKFINPQHAMAVWKKFYFISEMNSTGIYIVGSIQMLIVIMFVLGIFKRVSYGAILILHAVSTFSALQKYLDPWSNLLFFAAWPMLAACIGLYLLRSEDTFLTLK